MSWHRRANAAMRSKKRGYWSGSDTRPEPHSRHAVSGLRFPRAPCPDACRHSAPHRDDPQTGRDEGARNRATARDSANRRRPAPRRRPQARGGHQGARRATGRPAGRRPHSISSAVQTAQLAFEEAQTAQARLESSTSAGHVATGRNAGYRRTRASWKRHYEKPWYSKGSMRVWYVHGPSISLRPCVTLQHLLPP